MDIRGVSFNQEVQSFNSLEIVSSDNATRFTFRSVPCDVVRVLKGRDAIVSKNYSVIFNGDNEEIRVCVYPEDLKGALSYLVGRLRSNKFCFFLKTKTMVLSLDLYKGELCTHSHSFHLNDFRCRVNFHTLSLSVSTTHSGEKSEILSFELSETLEILFFFNLVESMSYGSVDFILDQRDLIRRFTLLDEDMSFQDFMNLPITFQRFGNTVDPSWFDRYLNILPYTNNRFVFKNSHVVTNSVPCNENSYINASPFRLSLSEREIDFIMTQWPLDHTIEDFWRMLDQSETSMVVLLSSKSQISNVLVYPRYWPENTGESIKMKTTGLTITFSEKIQKNGLTVNRFLLRSRKGMERDILQVATDMWEDHSDVDLDILNKLAEETMLHIDREKKRKHSIVVHCGAGIGRTGTFIIFIITKYFLKGSLKMDMVDNFLLHWTRRLREHRIGIIDSPLQFKLLYSYFKTANP